MAKRRTVLSSQDFLCFINADGYLITISIRTDMSKKQRRSSSEADNIAWYVANSADAKQRLTDAVYRLHCLPHTKQYFDTLTGNEMHWNKFKDKRGKDITKTRLFKYIENFISKKWKFSDKKFWYFSYFCSKQPPRGGSNEYPQSMFLSRNKKNDVYPCKPQFYYIKVGFKRVNII